MNKRVTILASLCSILSLIGLVIAISAGAKQIPLQTIWDSIFHYEPTIDMEVIRNARIPRAVCSAIVGGLLGVCGAMMQGVTRNPIAEPSIMGISQGATLAISCLYLSPAVYGMLGRTTMAFVGASISGIIVLFFSIQKSRSMNMSRLLLAGTALSTFFISLATVIALLTNHAQSLAFWVAGGLKSVTWSNVWLVLFIGVTGIVLSILLAPRINVVHLGEDVAIGLGENPTKVRIYSLVLIIPITAACVAVAGNIAFVGLIIPQIIRRIVGADYRFILPLSFLAGSTLLIWSDIAARLINQPYETPIGLFTSLLGVPFFLWMVRKERA